jgi:ATP-dependent helicase HrpA
MLKKTKEVPVRVIPNPINFPSDLPVCERREEIREAISQHQVVIIAGETGSGKTTQIPKICLELGRGQEARIGHTQPRRLAARRVAERIADELGSELGGLVGYKVRFNDSVAPSTAIKLMTDGILLAELQRDRELRDYDTLIIDEAHERSLNIDFILGYLRALLPKRPDLKVIITSATIDVERFSQHFNNAPVIEVSGRLFPVEVHYLGDSDDAEDGVEDQIVRAVDGIVAEDFGPRGDVLIFLPGEREIRDLSRRLKGDERRQILPLYARLSVKEQNRVFKPSGSGMRVVLATNVAETSLTVPGIRYVIDPGTARVSRYSHRTRLQRLPVERISQSSANQRKGRCGRVAAGVCLRLYSEQDFLARPEFTDPEILRTNLAAVVLKMLELGLGEVQKFPFVDPPEAKMVRDGQRLLEELGAISARGKLTALGRKMAKLPIDPKLARMVHASGELKCLEEVLVVVSALAVQDPRDRPAEKRAQADQAHARFNHPRSDFLSWLNLWRYYEEQRQALSQSQLRKLCQREFLSYLRLREWREVHGQLVIACRQVQLRPRSELSDETDFDEVHKALLSGLLGQVAQLDEGRKYNATRNRKVQIFPGSVLHKKPPKWLVAAEVVETSQVYARQCAAIDPLWLLRINPQILKRQHYEPAWQMRSGPWSHGKFLLETVWFRGTIKNHLHFLRLT